MPILFHQMPPILTKKINFDLKHVAILAPHVNIYPDDCKYLFETKDVFFDNMVFEGTPLFEEEYVSMINKYRPKLFVLPDEYGNLKRTIELHKHYRNSVPLDLTAMAVMPSIPSLDYINWCRDNRINVVGVPYVVEEGYNRKEHINRKMVIDFINKLAPEMKIHLLGIEHPAELYLYVSNSNIISADSTLAFVTSYFGKDLSHGEFVKSKISDSQIHLQNFDVNLLNRNLLYLKSIGWN